ncbi:MoaD/ThiS family protein [Dongia sp.]|uniref:MoaD/ThiS family protein n=1 Tax=Dongia sp. TaxID=1977262 RepID=UPI0035B061BF
MAKISFTAHLRKVAPAGATEVAAASLGDALDQVFARAPRLRSYVVDEQNRLRCHVVIFINGIKLPPENWSAQRLGADDDVYVMQALSGG